MTPAVSTAALDTPAALPLVARVSSALDAHGIAYCQWKGHAHSDRWVRGEGDLDLLVNRCDAGPLATALSAIAFKQVVPAPARQIPGTDNYYGFDPATRRFVHIHVHYHLRLGHYRTMNYHLPLETAVLGSSAPTPGGLRVAAPALEFVVFVVRMVLGHSMLSSLRRGGELSSPKRAVEWHYFASRVTRAEVSAILTQHFPGLTDALFDRCLRSLSPKCSLSTRLRVRRELERLLRTRRSLSADTVVRIRHAVSERVARLVGGGAHRHRFATGGFVLAVLGGDGSGKTTAVNELLAWLSPTFDTVAVHLGKPPRSLPTLLVGAVRRLVGWTRMPAGILLLVRSVCVARDRYRLYARACRQAAAGAIVICDRYPTAFLQKMDGPNIGASPAAPSAPRWLVGFLQRCERAYYARILPPDLSVVLRVDPEVAVARKTNEDPDYVRTRCRDVWELDLRGAPTRVLDANRPLADVHADLRSLVWSRL